MLTLYANGSAYPIKNDDYYIRQVDTGRDELIFNISIWDELYPLIVEEASIQDRDQMHYLIKAIDAGNDTAKVRCEIDLDEWRATFYPTFSNNSATCATTIQRVCPSNWTVSDQSGVTILRTIEGAYTPLEIVEACRDVYNVTFRWDNNNRVLTIVNPASYTPIGAFISRDLNLKELNYKGSSTNFITRLYAYGKDGLSISSVNNGLPYVDDNTYSNRIICGYWSDNRYESALNLLADAKTRLASMAVPSRSYTCSVYDLAKTNPDMYGFENLSLFAVVTLIDDSRKTAINYQIVEYWDYPHYPEKNDVVLSTSPARIQSQITQITQQVLNPNSSFNQQQTAAVSDAVANATQWLTSSDGYIVASINSANQWTELFFLDRPNLETAKNVLRINTNGIGFSTTGVNGPFANAWTIDGNLVASFITTGILKSADGKTFINLDTGSSQLTGRLITDSIELVDSETGVKYGSIYLGTHSNGTPAPALILYDTAGTQVVQLFTNDSNNPFLILRDDTGAQLQLSCSGNNAFINAYGTGSNAIKSNMNFKSAAGFLLGDTNESSSGHQFWLDTNKNAHLETDIIVLGGKTVFVDSNGNLKVPTT